MDINWLMIGTYTGVLVGLGTIIKLSYRGFSVFNNWVDRKILQVKNEILLIRENDLKHIDLKLDGLKEDIKEIKGML